MPRNGSIPLFSISIVNLTEGWQWLRVSRNFDFKTMLTKVLSSDFKKTPVYFNLNFVICWSAITNFKMLRELGLKENDVKDSLV